jgi:hypothetical protein
MRKLLVTSTIAVLLLGCAKDNKPKVVAVRQGVGGTMLPSLGLEAVRYGENIKAYPVSRYVDPNDTSVMHEGHILYRVESTAKWNLHPNLPVVVPMGPSVVVNNPSRRTQVLSQELESELANQRARSTEMVQQNQRFTGMIKDLQTTMQQAQQRLQETQSVKGEIDQMKRQIDELKLQVDDEKQKPPATSSSPPPAPKKGWFDFGQ